MIRCVSRRPGKAAARFVQQAPRGRLLGQAGPTGPGLPLAFRSVARILSRDVAYRLPCEAMQVWLLGRSFDVVWPTRHSPAPSPPALAGPPDGRRCTRPADGDVREGARMRDDRRAHGERGRTPLWRSPFPLLAHAARHLSEVASPAPALVAGSRWALRRLCRRGCFICPRVLTYPSGVMRVL